MTPQSFIFYGPSGCGKGTQAKLLIEYLKKNDPAREVIYIETGARIRGMINDTAGYTRDLVKNVLDHGGLLPEFVPIWIWSHYLITKFTGKEHLVLDGVARRPQESPIVESSLHFYGFEKPTVILMNVSKTWAKEKLKGRGRYDDDEAEIDRRLDWFEKNTVPAMHYFKNSQKSRFLEVNGEQPIEKVHEDIIAAVFGK